MGDFSLLNRKIFPYLLRNELHSTFNRKIFAYVLLLLVTRLGRDIFFKKEWVLPKNLREPQSDTFR